MQYLSKSLEDTKKIATDFANSLDGHHQGGNGATAVGLYGELGSGKTTFMKYFAEALGVSESVVSPTFVIMKIFDLTPHFVSPSPCEGEGRKGEVLKRLIHIDAYRLDNGEDLIKLGWNELISDPANVICIEWPEKVAEIMPAHIVVKFEHESETERKISIA